MKENNYQFSPPPTFPPITPPPKTKQKKPVLFQSQSLWKDRHH